MTHRPQASTHSPRRDLPGDFVEALVADLRPVSVAPGTAWALATWGALAVLLTGGTLLLLGPLREDALADLASTRLALEVALGLSTVLALAAAAFEIGVPGGPRRERLLGPAAALGAAWLAVALGTIDLDGPVTSMLDKRPHCLLEGLLIGILPALLGLRVAWRRGLGVGAPSGLLVGLSAGALPAIAMQIACMYDPVHALRFHFPPVLMLGLATGALASALSARS